MTGTITLPEGIEVAMPGDSLTLKVDFVDFAPLQIGLRFVIRESHSTIGAGVITDLLA
jgi:elongation factor Tu